MAVATDLHLEVDWNSDADFGDTYDDVTDLAWNIQTFTGRDNASSLTGKAGAGKLTALLNNMDDRFSPFNADSVLTETPTFVAAGTSSTANGSAPTPTLPAGMALGDYMVCVFYSREATDGTVAISSGWRQLYNARTSGGLMAIWGRVYHTGDAAPTFTLGGHAAGDDVIAHIAAWRKVNTARPIGVLGTMSTNGSAQDIGAISGITLQSKGLLIVVGGKADDWTSVATLSQTGMTFAEIGEPDTTTGNDAGLVWDYATVDAGTSLAVTNKTFAVTGGASAVGKGVMFSLNGATQVKPGALVRLRDDTDVLWIGKLQRILPSVAASGLHTATLEAVGILAEVANIDTLPIVSGTGADTGTLIAAALDDAGLDDSGVDVGDITTGPFGTTSSTANLLQQIRNLEETERGFLYEDQGDYRLYFKKASDRAAITSSAATFSDDPAETLHYEAIREEDYAGYIFNRCVAGVSPYSLADAATLVTLPGPYALQPGGSQNLIASYTANPLVSFTGHQRDIYYGSNVPVHQSITGGTSAGFDLTPTITYPATVTADDLLLLLFISELTGTIVAAPSGWETALLNYSLPAGDVNFGVFFKKAVGNEDGTTFAGPTINAARRSSWQIYRDTSWNGKDVDVEISPTPTTGTSSAPDGPSITPSWGALKSMFLSVLVSTTDSTLWNASASPSGYTFGLKTVSPNGYGLNSAYRAESTGVTSENPGAFTMSSSKLWAAFTIAIRGLRSSSLNVVGATPNTQDGAFTISYDNSLGGGVGQQDHENIRVTGTYLVAGDESLVQADYLPSQAVVGVRSYRSASNLFANITDAQAYADEVVKDFGEPRPVMSMSYTANKNSSLYAQAIALQVNNRVTLEANNNAGLGVAEDFFIESIARNITPGQLHQVTYALSPASVSDT